MTEAGLDEPPYFINLVLGVHRGFQNAMPYSPRVMQMMVDMLPKDSIFCVSGIGPTPLPALATSPRKSDPKRSTRSFSRSSGTSASSSKRKEPIPAERQGRDHIVAENRRCPRRT